jgi:hypothetical protein
VRPPRRAAPWRLGVLASALLAGCDSAPPSAPATDDVSDPVAISAAVSNFELAIGTPAMHSLGVVAARMIIPGTAAAAPLETPASWCGPGRSPRPTVPAPTAPHPAANLIADSLFRRVYTYDAVSRTFQWTSAASGPANGVRFLLDDLDNYGGYILPRTQVGWLDLTDAVAGGLDRLRAQVVNGSAVNADVLVAPSGSSTAYTASQAGRVAAGTATFTFLDSVQVNGTETDRLAVIDSAGPGVRIALRAKRVDFDAADFRYDIDLTASRGSTTIRLTGANVVYCYFGSWDVAVTLNDSAFATYTRSDIGTAVTPAAGRTLSQQQSRVILDLMDMQQLLFDWLRTLFMPVWRLLPP